MKSDMLFK